MKPFIQWAGTFNILSGLLMLAYWFLYAILLPYRQLSTTLTILVENKNWVFVNLLGAAGGLLGIVGLVGIYISLDGQGGRLIHAGFIIALLGTVLMSAALLRDTVLWPVLASHDPELLSFSGPIYTSRTFVPFFIFSGAVYSIGLLLFGLAAASAGIFPAWTVHLLAWGALLFGLGAAFGDWQVLIRSIGISGFSIGLMAIGFLMRQL